MQKQYSLDKYMRAAQALGELHGLAVIVFDKYAPYIVFKVYIAKEEKLVPLDQWTIHTVGKPAFIGSAEYLKLPAEYINRASQAEFESIIESL